MLSDIGLQVLYPGRVMIFHDKFLTLFYRDQDNFESVSGEVSTSSIKINSSDEFVTRPTLRTLTSTTRTTSLADDRTNLQNDYEVSVDYEYSLVTDEPPTTINVKILPKSREREIQNKEILTTTYPTETISSGYPIDFSGFVHDFVQGHILEPEIHEEMPRSPKVTKPRKTSTKVEAWTKPPLDSDSETFQEDSPYVINIFNNQVYEQTVSDEARLVNNHHQNINFDDQSSPAQGGPRSQVLTEL